MTSAPGERATIIGRIYIPKSSSHVRVTRLRLDGRNHGDLPSPTIDATGDQFIGDDVTNDHTAICFGLGADEYGQARRTLIERNRIHDCGVLPSTNHDHGIYVANSVGAQILDNVIYDNADRGIQLYWNAQRTTIAGNIIDHNGEGILIAGDASSASSDNLIIDNIITNSTVRADVESYWPDASLKGTGNVVFDNCVHGGRKTIDSSAGGFLARDNRNVNPRYADAVAGDYRLPTGSPCAVVIAKAVSSANSYLRRLSG